MYVQLKPGRWDVQHSHRFQYLLRESSSLRNLRCALLSTAYFLEGWPDHSKTTKGISRASTQSRCLSFFRADRAGPFGYRRLRHENTTAFLDACGGMGSFGLRAPVVPREHVSQRLLSIMLSRRCVSYQSI